MQNNTLYLVPVYAGGYVISNQESRPTDSGESELSWDETIDNWIRLSSYDGSFICEAEDVMTTEETKYDDDILDESMTIQEALQKMQEEKTAGDFDDENIQQKLQHRKQQTKEMRACQFAKYSTQANIGQFVDERKKQTGHSIDTQKAEKILHDRYNEMFEGYATGDADIYKKIINAVMLCETREQPFSTILYDEFIDEVVENILISNQVAHA